MAAWLKAAKTIEPVRQLYILATYSPNTIESRFLLLARAVEVYHRRRMNGTYLEPDIFKALVTDLQDTISKRGVPAPASTVLANKLTYLNEFSLARRIQDLVKLNTDAIHLHVNWTKELTRELADARNELIHHGSDREPVEPQRLLYLNRVLEFLLEILFLREMGLDTKHISRLVDNCEAYYVLFPR